MKRNFGQGCESQHTKRRRLRGATPVRGQWQPGGDTPRPRSGAARRSHLAPETRGGSWEEPPTPEPRASGREKQPEEWWLHRHRRA